MQVTDLSKLVSSQHVLTLAALYIGHASMLYMQESLHVQVAAAL